MDGLTIPQQIVVILKASELTPRELARSIGLPLSRILTELEHVALSERGRLKVRAARCRGCDFKFSKRRRLSTPSRCPKCRAEGIEGPFLSVKK